MIGDLFCPGLLETGAISDKLMVVRDGLMNLYILKSPHGLVCIDTGWRAAHLSRGFEMLGLSIRDVTAVLLTHLHWDHARCLPCFPDAVAFVSKRERPPLFTNWTEREPPLEGVEDGQTIAAGGLAVRVIETPGHTPGSVSYAVDDLLFIGDALRLSRGTVHPFPFWFNRDARSHKQSIHKLARLKGTRCLLTAHDGMSTDIEKAFAGWGDTPDCSLQVGAPS